MKEPVEEDPSELEERNHVTENEAEEHDIVATRSSLQTESTTDSQNAKVEADGKKKNKKKEKEEKKNKKKEKEEKKNKKNKNIGEDKAEIVTPGWFK